MDEPSQQKGDKRRSRSGQARAPRATEPCCGHSPLSTAVLDLGNTQQGLCFIPFVSETGRVPPSSEGREDMDGAQRMAACVAASGDERLPEDCRVGPTGSVQKDPALLV